MNPLKQASIEKKQLEQAITKQIQVYLDKWPELEVDGSEVHFDKKLKFKEIKLLIALPK